MLDFHGQCEKSYTACFPNCKHFLAGFGTYKKYCLLFALPAYMLYEQTIQM
jgi:hypothetical protein